MNINHLDKLFQWIQNNLYLLSLNEQNCIHPITKEEKLKIGRIVNDLRGKIENYLTTAKKLNRMSSESYSPSSTENLRDKLTRSQDSIMIDSATIIKYQCILQALFTQLI